MPSGSHGGSAGGHGGGSSGGHGGSHFGSSRGGFNRGPRVIMFFGHPHYINSRKSGWLSFLSMLIVISVIALIIMLFGLSASSNEIKVIENDYNYYQQMIKRAESNPAYIKQATITGHFVKNGYDKWYMTYTIEQNDGNLLEGYTFSIYTLEDLNQYTIGSIVDAAVDSIIVTKDTDSITMDYKNTTLKDDCEYERNIHSKTTFTIGSIVDAIILVGLIVLIIVIIQKSAASPEQEKLQQENQLRKCPYCGAKIKNTKDKCPNCGANLE